MNVSTPSGGKITPLWIVAMFVTFTEVAVTAAVTQTDGGIQIALTTFVILYALLVFAAFFLVLWYRPFVFYPPSEFPNADPQKFVDAIRGTDPLLDKQIRLVTRATEEPENSEARFQLINPLIDDAFRQFIILMKESGIRLPMRDTFGPSYEIARKGSWSSGTLSAFDMARKLDGTGLLNIEASGPSLELTALGKEFAQWLVDHGLKADFVHTQYGGWGDVNEFREIGSYFRHHMMSDLSNPPTGQSQSPDQPPSTPPADQSNAG